MAHVPEPVAAFLRGRRLAVAGVSREGGLPANAIFRKLREAGYEVFPLNPNASEVEGVACYADPGALPQPVDGVVVATPPDVSAEVVRQCVAHGVERVWLHRSFGQGSVSEAAIREGEAHGIECLVGGCPLMYCEPVDVVHRCMWWWLRRQGRLPR